MEVRHKLKPSFRDENEPAAQASQVPPRPPAKKPSFFYGRRWAMIVIAILVVGVGFLAYGYIHTKNQLNAAKNPAVAGKTEIAQIENQINKVVAVPNETPTLATVSDAQKLQAQIFFKNAQNGDKVLIFPHAGTALLYRPSTKKVIEYAPVNLGSNQ